MSGSGSMPADDEVEEEIDLDDPQICRMVSLWGLCEIRYDICKKRCVQTTDKIIWKCFRHTSL